VSRRDVCTNVMVSGNTCVLYIMYPTLTRIVTLDFVIIFKTVNISMKN
jgi:hypothetical protein